MKTKEILQYILNNAPDWFLNGVKIIDMEHLCLGKIYIPMELPWQEDVCCTLELDNLESDFLKFIKENELLMKERIDELAKIIGKKVVIE